MKFVGTGVNPRYPKGQEFDLPVTQPATIHEVLDNKWAEKGPAVAIGEHQGVGEKLDLKNPQHVTRVIEVANRIVRGEIRGNEAIFDSVREIVDWIGDRAHAIVHLQDPSASNSDVPGLDHDSPAPAGSTVVLPEDTSLVDAFKSAPRQQELAKSEQVSHETDDQGVPKPAQSESEAQKSKDAPKTASGKK